MFELIKSQNNCNFRHKHFANLDLCTVDFHFFFQILHFNFPKTMGPNLKSARKFLEINKNNMIIPLPPSLDFLLAF